MTESSFDLAAYRNWVRMSRNKRIVVEGRDDKQVFLMFLEELRERAGIGEEVAGVAVDSAEHMIGFETALGNREKVETLCSTLSGTPDAEKIVGFVDREFREFDRGTPLHDCVQAHKRRDRLVWSRGHSIENYCFDFDVLRRPLCDLPKAEADRQALGLMQSVFENAIRLACSASLAGEELGKLDKVEASVHWQILDLALQPEPKLLLNLRGWQEKLVRSHGVGVPVAESLVGAFQARSEQVDASDFDVVRWMCHGHIGFKFIWEAYSRCVLETCLQRDPDRGRARKAADKALGTDTSVRLKVCARAWVHRALGDHCCYPAEVFTLLGIPVHSSWA